MKLTPFTKEQQLVNEVNTLVEEAIMSFGAEVVLKMLSPLSQTLDEDRRLNPKVYAPEVIFRRRVL